jgi:hypothetical protein
LQRPKEFNFIEFNFLRKKNAYTYYDLGNGQVIRFTSLTEVWNQFRAVKAQ